jgi:hypothetical protein
MSTCWTMIVCTNSPVNVCYAHHFMPETALAHELQHLGLIVAAVGRWDIVEAQQHECVGRPVNQLGNSVHQNGLLLPETGDLSTDHQVNPASGVYYV